MKIIVLEGSPNQHGSSNMLADNFIRGAEEAGLSHRCIITECQRSSKY